MPRATPLILAVIMISANPFALGATEGSEIFYQPQGNGHSLDIELERNQSTEKSTNSLNQQIEEEEKQNFLNLLYYYGFNDQHSIRVNFSFEKSDEETTTNSTITEEEETQGFSDIGLAYQGHALTNIGKIYFGGFTSINWQTRTLEQKDSINNESNATSGVSRVDAFVGYLRDVSSGYFGIRLQLNIFSMDGELEQTDTSGNVSNFDLIPGGLLIADLFYEMDLGIFLWGVVYNFQQVDKIDIELNGVKVSETPKETKHSVKVYGRYPIGKKMDLLAHFSYGSIQQDDVPAQTFDKGTEASLMAGLRTQF